MCNRYSAARKEEIRHYLKQLTGQDLPEDWSPSYNIPPTSRVPVVVRDPAWSAKLMRWGTASPAGLLMNARAETLSEKPMWKRLAAGRRCLMFADGFFEWETSGRKKLGHYFSLKDRAAFCMAGLWLPASGGEPDRCVIVTCEPNPLVRPFHDRMPAILDDQAALTWLGEGGLQSAQIAALCRPYSEQRMNHWRVSPEVNSNKYQEPGALAPFVPEPDLFG